MGGEGEERGRGGIDDPQDFQLATGLTCLVPRTRTCLGDRAFGVAGPRLWNALPISLRQPHLSLRQFRLALKMHLF